MKKLLVALFLILLAGSSAHADTVVFKNGDKLTGTLINVRDVNLTLKSDLLGNIVIALSKVQSIAVEKPAVILGKDRKVVRGQVALQTTGDWAVTANGASQTVSAANVSVILPEDSYHALAEVPAKIWQDWKGAANFGYSLQHGDQQTHTISSVVAATRERPSDLLFTPHLRTIYGLTMLFSKAQQDGTLVSSDTISTNLQLDWLFTNRNFIFSAAQLDHIQAQGLYLRQTFGGGFGRDVIHSDRTLLSILGGLDYVHERFIAGRSDRSVEALTGEKLGMQLSRRVRLDHQLNFYPDLQHASHFRWDTSTNLSLKINNRLTANAGAIDLYLNKPAPGSHQNNIAVTTGLGYTF